MDLRPAPERGIRDRVHVADDHVGPVSGLEQRVRPAVDCDQHRLEVADIRPNNAQVALVPRPTGDDERVAVPEARAQWRKVDSLREEPTLLA
jgi:hypothetical protein